MSGFYEDDEPAADVAAAFARGRAGRTAPGWRAARVWACAHMTASGPLLRVTCWHHGCDMQPVG
jgi:hypothetical protein